MLLCCLRRNVEASCHTRRRRLPPSTNSAAYQRLVSSTRHGPSQLSVLHLAFTASDGAIGSESRFLPTPPAFDASVRGFPSECCHDIGMENLEWCGYSTVKTFWRYVESFWQNPQTWQTHTQRQTPHRPRLHSIARQKLTATITVT